MNYHRSRTSTCVLASPVEFLANRAPTSDLFRKSPRVLLSHKVHYAATSLTSWFSVPVPFNVSCHFPQCGHPITRVAWSAISSFYSSTTPVFHDISLPRHQSSTTPVFHDTSLLRHQSSTTPVFHDTSLPQHQSSTSPVTFFSLVTTLAWIQLLS